MQAGKTLEGHCETSLNPDLHFEQIRKLPSAQLSGRVLNSGMETAGAGVAGCAGGAGTTYVWQPFLVAMGTKPGLHVAHTVPLWLLDSQRLQFQLKSACGERGSAARAAGGSRSSLLLDRVGAALHRGTWGWQSNQSRLVQGLLRRHVRWAAPTRRQHVKLLALQCCLHAAAAAVVLAQRLTLKMVQPRSAVVNGALDSWASLRPLRRTCWAAAAPPVDARPEWWCGKGVWQLIKVHYGSYRQESTCETHLHLYWLGPSLSRSGDTAEGVSCN